MTQAAADTPTIDDTTDAPTSSLTADAGHVLCGFLMGGADIIPGVSGGTVALVLGIYDRLLNAISRVDLTLLGHLRERRWREAAWHLDLRFLAALLCGIGVGIISLASLMHWLLQYQRTPTFAVFSGMIFGSAILVARRVRGWDLMRGGIAIVAAVGCAFIVTQPALQNPPTAFWYFYLCGVIAISAMVLPGLSGALILLMLGHYSTITGYLQSLLHLNVSMEMLLSLSMFCLGCLTGLLVFSRVLKRLLATHHCATMAALVGLMAGALVKLWPFVIDATPDEADLKLKVWKAYMPDSVNGLVITATVLFAVGVGSVLLLEYVANRWGAGARESATSETSSGTAL